MMQNFDEILKIHQFFETFWLEISVKSFKIPNKYHETRISVITYLFEMPLMVVNVDDDEVIAVNNDIRILFRSHQSKKH